MKGFLARSLPPLPRPEKPVARSSQFQAKLGWWLSNLLPKDDFQDKHGPEIIDEMSQPPPKRSRSSDTSKRSSSQSEDGSETASARERKYTVYKAVNYPTVLETKGAFMRASKAGLFKEDKELYDKLFTNVQPRIGDDLFSDAHFNPFHTNLRGRSEARICIDLHPRLVPSAENLYICGREEFAGIIEGHNDPWVKAISFYGPRPQPDHTFGFKWSNFNEQQRQKLMIEPSEKSYYTAREDIYFPFLTAEVKCGRIGLELADRANMHSMIVGMRGIVDLYRRVGRPNDIHRRLLGLSISHDDNSIRIHAYWPEIDGDHTTYWRGYSKDFSIGNDEGRDRWASYQFTVNACQLFGLPLLKRLRDVIDDMPDPNSQSMTLAATLDEISVQSSQEELSAPESQDENFKKPRNVRGLNAELRSMIQNQQRQLELQTEDAKKREQLFLSQLETQTNDARKREALLVSQLEQQQKTSEEQQKRWEEQQKKAEEQREKSEQLLNRVMEMLQGQREENKGLREQLQHLLAR